MTRSVQPQERVGRGLGRLGFTRLTGLVEGVTAPGSSRGRRRGRGELGPAQPVLTFPWGKAGRAGPPVRTGGP